jgi:diaminopimelate epimerase
LKTCDLTARDGFHFEFRTSLGPPEVGGEFTVSVRDRVVRGVPVSMGNPHFIVFVHEFEPGWQTWAGQVSTQPDFPQGTNVELVRVLNEHEIDVRFGGCGCLDSHRQGNISPACARSRRNANRRVGSRIAALWACNDTLSRRIFRLR